MSLGLYTAATASPAPWTENAVAAKVACDDFDVFMAHNNRDKPLVLELGRRLRAVGIYPWIDIEQIPPGRWFQDVIQSIIPRVLGGHPKPAIKRHLKTGHFLRLVSRREPRPDALCVSGRHGERLGPEQAAASGGAGAPGLVAAPHRAGHGRPARDHRGYLRTAGVAVRGRGRPRADAPAAPSEATAKPAILSAGVSTDSAPSRAPSASACAPTAS